MLLMVVRLYVIPGIKSSKSSWTHFKYLEGSDAHATIPHYWEATSPDEGHPRLRVQVQSWRRPTNLEPHISEISMARYYARTEEALLMNDETSKSIRKFDCTIDGSVDWIQLLPLQSRLNQDLPDKDAQRAETQTDDY